MLNVFKLAQDLEFFKKSLDGLDAKVDALQSDSVLRQTALGEQLATVIGQLTEASLTVKETEDRFAACAGGFRQIKEACEVLLDRLDEALGVCTERSWNNGVE